MNLLIGKNSNKKLLIIALLLMLSIFIAYPASAQTTASIDRTAVSEGESLTLIIESDSDQADSPQISVLEQDFDILGQSQSQNYSIINGHARSSKKWHFAITPKRTGTVIIPAIQVGNTVTQPITLQVTTEVESHATPTTKSKSLFLTTEIDEATPFIQSQVTFTVKLFHANNLTEGALSELKINEAIIERLGDKKTYSAEINGKTYQVIEIKFAIFPQKSGEMIIPEMIFEGAASIRNTSLFDTLSNFSQRKVKETSPALTLNVKPIPEGFSNKSPWFTASYLKSEESILPVISEYKVGDAITRKVILTAENQIATSLPNGFLTFNQADVKTYTDQAKNNQIFDGAHLISTHEESIAIIPTKEGTITLPAIEIPWWNTEKKQLMLLKIAEKKITVQADPALKNAFVNQSANQEKLANSIKEQRLPVESQKNSQDKTPSENKTLIIFLMAVIALLILLIGIMLYQKPREAVKKLLKRLTKRNQGKIKTTSNIKEQNNLTLKSIKKNILKNAAENNAIETKINLLSFGTVLLDIPILTLGQLREKIEHPTLDEQIKILEQALYSEQQPWIGDLFSLAFEDWHNNRHPMKKKKENTKRRLPSLYP